MFKFEPVRHVFLFAWFLLSVAEWSFADPCTELGRAINAYADAAETLATTIQRLRPQLEKLPEDEPEACKAANRRLEAFQPEINAVIEKLDYKRRRYSADPGVTNAWRRVIRITNG